MEIKAVIGEVTKIKIDAVMVHHFEGLKRLDNNTVAVDKVLGSAISRLVNQGEIKGKLGEVTIIYSLGKLPAVKVAIIGLGKKEELTMDRVRGTVAEACRLLRKRGVKSIAAVPYGVGASDIGLGSAAQVITEGALLGLYAFRKHITKEPEYGEVEQLLIMTGDKPALVKLEEGINKGRVMAEAVNLARDMVNEPANYMTPAHMEGEARRLADAYGFEITVLGRERMKEMGMGALLGVAQGSKQPPKLIVLSYRGKDSAGVDVALIGKGITFDSGGISIKPSAKMEEMKGDMAGGAAVIAAISSIAQLKPKINVMAIIPATENLPSENALKPGDVLTAMNGKTIEIISTDAEGRLALADALGYAKKFGAKSLVDVATLTGACVIALGKVCTGAFGNNQELIDRILAAGAEAGELIWQMPMYEQYKEQNKSDVADIKNVGGRYGGAITGAQFIAEFAEDTPWVHLDIAGTFMADKEQNYLAKGATGVSVRTLVNLVLSLAK